MVREVGVSGFGWRVCVVALGLALAAGSAAAAEDPAIARPGMPKIGISAADARGVVFFLASEIEPGVVAVGTGHTLRLGDLARAGRVEFALPRSLSRAGSAEAFAVPPGQPFSLPGASMRDDFVVFRLTEAPKGVRALEADGEATLAAGTRVRILGPPKQGRRDEQEVYGTVLSAAPDRVEIDLDLSQRLSGWGGAPVLLSEAGTVVGLVEAAVPGSGNTRVLAAPIGGVLEALAEPLEGGAGSAFAAFAPGDAKPPEPTPTPTPARKDGKRALLRPMDGDSTHIDLLIEYPPSGSEVESTVCGTFVAGRALATQGEPRSFDVILVIDTSASTSETTGTDVNGNGVIGRPRLGRIGAIFGSSVTDEGDTILAAEVAAARQVLRGLDPRNTRVGLVGFAGDAGSAGNYAPRRPAYTIEALTRDYERIERGLDEVLATDPEGSTHMSAGLDQATMELKGLRGAYSKPDPTTEKVVFFFTDGQPTLPYGPSAESDNVRAVLRAANRARRARITVHSFAIGPEALEGPIATVEMAARTNGYFTPVRDPGDLVDVVEEVSFADIRDVQLSHAKTRVEANPFRVTADGSWAGFIALEPGKNPLRVEATTVDGKSARETLEVELVEDARNAPELPKALLVQRNRLLEDCLLLAKQERLQREKDHHDELRKQLRIEIERERRAARKRAAEQRKTLELEGELDDE
ncbi:MAG: vWA domain-containing protein [Myxococcota bacterium]